MGHSPAETKRALVTLGICHLMNANRIPKLNRNLQWRDQDVLLLIRGIRCVDLVAISESVYCMSRKRHTIIFILMRRFTASMKTSNSSREASSVQTPTPDKLASTYPNT